ncbi:MAG: hypothetical protein WCE44_13095 [Candidatus Velthaea sp.]|jgi:hypothetical protein
MQASSPFPGAGTQAPGKSKSSILGPAFLTSAAIATIAFFLVLSPAIHTYTTTTNSAPVHSALPVLGTLTRGGTVPCDRAGANPMDSAKANNADASGDLHCVY